MPFIDEGRLARLKGDQFKVDPKRARDNAHLHVLMSVGSRVPGTEGWERGRMPTRPRVVYDLSGLPLFYDYTLHRGRKAAGVVRTAANRALGDPVVSTQLGAPGWNARTARAELTRLIARKYPRHAIRRVQLVCYSYPKLALKAELAQQRGASKTILMDVGDFSEIQFEPKPLDRDIGQVPYSLLSAIPEDKETPNLRSWEKVDGKVAEVIEQERRLAADRFYAVAPTARFATMETSLTRVELFELVTERVLDFCCHTGTCHDHQCFCLHPQENNVHCARAAGQMMLCYWRYCFSQPQIAQAYGVSVNVGTPPGAIVPGLESLTTDCFDATWHNIASWTLCRGEINARRPFMSCVPGHARACAGYKEWNIWVVNMPKPRYLRIFDPWPPNTGAIYWENFNTTNYSTSYGAFTLERKTTNHV